MKYSVYASKKIACSNCYKRQRVLPEDSWLIMSVETWMANQYILDLIKNVKRWIESKYAKWVRPTRTPLWYLNDRNNYWEAIEDPERFHIIRKMWDMMLTWTQTPTHIVQKGKNELEFYVIKSI